MAPLTATLPEIHEGIGVSSREIFSYSNWNLALPLLAQEYRDNDPCPHIRIMDFINPEFAEEMAEEFPAMGTDSWTKYKHKNENKLGLSHRNLFPELIGQAVDELNSPAFVSWLSQLTGIAGLMPDPSLEGGGLHQSGRGGFLNVHTDFSAHHYHKNWRRQVNLILYLNPNWQPEWGGSLELWDPGVRNCAVKYLPLINHAVIFTTNEKSLHGFPDPLTCPESVSRKSLALYYYTEEKTELQARSTDYRPRPEDGLYKSAMIWLDKKAVDLYSKAKARFGFSDDFASRVLGLLSRTRKS